MPSISVIVPVYQAEKVLRTCTDSILKQSFSDFELLLIDDGSPDSSGALCDRIAEEDPRVRVFHKENGGVSSARNVGMEEAKGKFLAFADSDDWLPVDALQRMFEAVEAAGGDTAGGAHYKAESSGELELEEGAMPPGVYGPEEMRAGIVHRLLGHRLGPANGVLNGFIWRFLFSRELVMREKIRFVGAYLEDELFLIEYFCQAKKLVMVKESVYYYLQNPASVTRNYLKDYMETFSRFMVRKEELAKRFGLDGEVAHWHENSNWAGLLIAIGNEYAPGNPATFWEKRRRVKELVSIPAMREAIRTLRPEGLGRNKQIVADLVRKRMFFLLTVLYAVKNRGR